MRWNGTRAVSVARSDAVVEVLTALQALGVQLGLDDFGIGCETSGAVRF
jgi:EAL domain-containing protein (putative c-di-GMP-specific phosphodiesterase class I)